MVEQHSLFDQREAIRRRDEAVARVGAHAVESWLDDAYDAVVSVASRRVPFTTDDVWEVLGYGTREPRALGAVMRRAFKAGVIVPLNEWRPSDRPQAHRNPKRLWMAA